MSVTHPHVAHVAGRTLGSGPVVAVFTDHPCDMAVAAHAAGLAAASGTLLIAAAAVHSSGLSAATLVHRARSRRLHPDSVAIVGRVTPILHTAGVAYLRSMVVLPAGADALHALPVTAVRQLVDRFSAVAVVTARPLRDPSGVLKPATPRPRITHERPDHPNTHRYVTF